MATCRRGYAGVGANVCKYEGEGALRGWRKCVGADTHIRKCRGMRALARGRMYTKAQTKVRYRGGQVWLRVGVGMQG